MKTNVLKTRVRETFDISNKKHIKIARDFFENGSWGVSGCPFKAEFPYQSVPNMIKTQIVYKFLKIDQTVDQKTRIF
jgi:hypothetical protein